VPLPLAFHSRSAYIYIHVELQQPQPDLQIPLVVRRGAPDDDKAVADEERISQGDRVYAGAFLVISALAQGWVFGMVIYLAVFAAVTGAFLRPEANSLLRLAGAVMKRKKDVAVVQREE